jgi:hypothetical protein
LPKKVKVIIQKRRFNDEEKEAVLPGTLGHEN